MVQADRWIQSQDTKAAKAKAFCALEAAQPPYTTSFETYASSGERLFGQDWASIDFADNFVDIPAEEQRESAMLHDLDLGRFRLVGLPGQFACSTRTMPLQDPLMQ